jgi:copper transport protein
MLTGRGPGAVRVLLRSAALVVGVGLATLLLAQPASAHADLVRSDPADGARLLQPPTVARLWFSEEISPEFSAARVVDGHGSTVAGSALQADTGDPRLLAVKLPDLAAGTYGVVWRVLAEDDGHTTRGVVVFTVGAAAAAAGPIIVGEPDADDTGTAATPVGALLRWLGLCSLAGLVGALAVAGPVLGRARGVAGDDAATAGIRLVRGRLLAIAAGSAAFGAAVGIAVLADAGRRASVGPGGSLAHVGLDLLTSTRWGHLWLAREAALITLAILILAMRSGLGEPRDRRTAARSAAAVTLVLALAWVEALGSHAVAVESARLAAVVAYTLHVLTALLWLGGLPAFVLVLWPGVPGLGRRELVRACRGPFTALALTSVTILVITGLYGAGRQVPEPGQLLTTSYGQTLVLKTALLAAVGGLGLANSALLHGRRLGRGGRLVLTATGGAPSRRLILTEAAVGAVLLAAAGVLAETAPPGPALPAAPAAEARLSDATVADLVISVSASPNQPGVNGFTVLAASSRRPPPAPIDGVELKLSEADTTTAIPLQQLEPGRYFGTARLDSAGPVTITAVVRRDGQRLTVDVPWQVSTEPAPAVSPRPDYRLAPYVNAIALGLLLLALGAGARLLAVRHKRQQFDEAPPAAEERILEDVR